MPSSRSRHDAADRVAKAAGDGFCASSFTLCSSLQSFRRPKKNRTLFPLSHGYPTFRCRVCSPSNTPSHPISVPYRRNKYPVFQYTFSPDFVQCSREECSGICKETSNVFEGEVPRKAPVLHFHCLFLLGLMRTHHHSDSGLGSMSSSSAIKSFTMHTNLSLSQKSQSLSASPIMPRSTNSLSFSPPKASPQPLAFRTLHSALAVAPQIPRTPSHKSRSKLTLERHASLPAEPPPSNASRAEEEDATIRVWRNWKRSSCTRSMSTTWIASC